MNQGVRDVRTQLLSLISDFLLLILRTQNSLSLYCKNGQLLSMCVLNCISCVQLFATRWMVARQAPLSMGFSRQEFWSRLPFPSPGDLPKPEIKPWSLVITRRFFPIWATKQNISRMLNGIFLLPQSQTREECMRRPLHFKDNFWKLHYLPSRAQ